MLTDRLGLPASGARLCSFTCDRALGRQGRCPVGPGARRSRSPVRIVHVARDAAFQRMLGGAEFAARSSASGRAARSIRPSPSRFADAAAEILALDADASVWDGDAGLRARPAVDAGGRGDRPRAGGDGRLRRPRLAVPGRPLGRRRRAGRGRRPGAAVSTPRDLVRSGARRSSTISGGSRSRSASGRSAAPLTPDDWERVRLHAYHTERVLSPLAVPRRARARSPTFHHERLDGSGYHRGAAAAALAPPARLLAAADAYHAMTEPRPHRAALLARSRPPRPSAREARAGRLDPDAVAAVLEAAGQRGPADRAAGGADRARGRGRRPARARPADQAGRPRRSGSRSRPPTATSRTPTRKIGVSTRAAAALFAMQHGLAAWGELPIGRTRDRS